MNLKAVSVVSEVIGILSVAILFVMNFKTECFKLGEWYLTLSPIIISYIAQFISIFVGEN